MSALAEILEQMSPKQRRLFLRRLRQKSELSEVAGVSAGGISPRQQVSDPPLSLNQQRLWFLSRLDPDSIAYNLVTAIILEGRLVIPAFQEAILEVVRRHEILRTTFGYRGDHEEELVQLIAHGPTIDVPLVDVGNLTPAVSAGEMKRIAGLLASRPYDLARGPLLRVLLVRQDSHEHGVVVAMHHIISDRWSIEIFIREVSALYQAMISGSPSPLPRLDIQYGDFALWQQRWFAGEKLEDQVRFWRRRLAGAPQVLELPTDRPRPAAQDYRGGKVPVALGKGETSRLRELCQRRSGTLFMTLLAVYQTLLCRWSGETDVVVGTPTSGRNRTEIEPLIGLFINTLTLRTDLSGNPVFDELLERVKETTSTAYTHQEVPFEKLVEELQPERSLSHSPLFQVVFIFQARTLVKNLELPGMKLKPLSFELNAAMFDLVLLIEESDAGLAGTIEYASELFDRSTILRLAVHLENLVSGVLQDPSRRLSALPMLSPPEQCQVVSEGSDTCCATEDWKPVHRWFEAHARRQGEAIALEFERQKVSYAELNLRSNRLARYLCRRGVGPESLVGIYVDRSLDMVLALLAVFKAGGAYVPLDPDYPLSRVAFMLRDSRTSFLLTERRHRDAVPEPVAQLLTLDDQPEELERESGSDLDLATARANLAYVIYTSGSTGRPKGVQISHGALSNFLETMASRPGFDRTDVLLSVTTLSFDIAGLEIYLPLVAGARLLLVSRETAVDGPLLASRIDACGATVMQATPATWNLLLSAGWEGAPRLRALCGGESLPPGLARKVAARVVSLWNLYGPTETTIWSSVAAVDARSMPPSIGRPIANTSIVLVDRYGALVSLGAAGELLIGGAGLARGYLRRPARTAERFVPDPFGTRPGRRLYRTGDLARRLRDGRLDYLGRLDSQVKVRGFRIELGEIEAALARHAEVAQSAAAIHEDPGGGSTLAAYVVRREGTASGKDEPQLVRELKAHLRTIVPDYMVPSYFVVLAAMPLTPNGKLDRKALPEPERLRKVGFVAPRNPVEEMLAGYFGEVLRHDEVGTTDNFFDLGGHSLLATQLLSRMRQGFGIDVPVRTIFEAPTVAELARYAEKAIREGQDVEQPDIVPVPREGPLAVSFAQQRLWFLHQLDSESAAYHIPAAVRWRGPFDSRAFRASFTEIVRRHEVLRTTFESEDGEPVQKIHPPEPLPIPEVDLSGLPRARREKTVTRLAREQAQLLFSLARGPLLRVAVLELGEQERVVLVTLHHIVSDAWSMGVLIRELSALYDAFTDGRSAPGGVSPLPELGIQYADFAVWQRQWLSETRIGRELEYWRGKLGSSPPVLELPADRPRPAVRSSAGARHPLRLPVELSEALRSRARSSGATLFMTLLSGFAVLLHRYTGKADIVVGTPVAGRNHLLTERLIGFFVNMLALAIPASGRQTTAQLLDRVRESTLEAFLHSDLPFERLVDVLQPQRDLRYTPLFQVVFQFDDDRLLSAADSEVDLEPLAVDSGTAMFDLRLVLGTGDRGFSGFAEYNTDILDGSTVARMSSHLERILEDLSARADERIADIGLLSTAEHAQLIREWNDTDVGHDGVRLIHELFEQRARLQADHLAVVSGTRHLSYRELNARANRLARHLRHLGVGRGTLVAVYLDRGAAMAPALLAVLKAGGAYVPLETRNPQARLLWILEAMRIPVILTDAGHLTTAAGFLSAAGGLRHVVCLDPLPRAVPELPAGRDLTGLADLDKLPDTAPPALSNSDDLAYVIFTSGSTGTPKGVMVRHRPVYNLIDWVNRTFCVDSRDRVLFTTSLGFDLSVYDLFGMLAAGGVVRVASREELEDPEALARALAHEPVTFWDSAPAALQVVTPFLPPADELPGASLRRVFLSGDWIPLALPDRIRHSFPAARVTALGGATEATVWSNFHPADVVEPKWKSIPYGRPIWNARYYVLGRRLRVCPILVPGDLYIAGGCLSSGYAGEPRLTATRYLPDPFDARRGSVMYATGDRARFWADGRIEFLGRLDHQVKIRGFRIELGEIESVLEQHSAVAESLVMVREDRPGERRLVAYLVPRADREPAPSDLIGFLGERLPEYMVPNAFVTLDAFPVTRNGKLDRKALPAPRATARAGIVAPRNAVEEALAAVWAEVLGRTAIGVDSNFFELGGDSILSVQMVSRAARKGIRLHPRHVFEYPTIDRLATVADLRGESPGSTVQVVGRVPLTPPQHWFFEQELDEANHFNQAVLLETTASWQPAWLVEAAEHLARHHDVLRMRFEPSESEPGGWEQINQAALDSVPGAWIDLSGLPAGRHREAVEASAERLQASLELTSGPLWRLVCFTLAEGKPGRLLFVVHHLVVDGVSWRVLVEDLETVCQQRAAGESVVLPPKTTSYRDWARTLVEEARRLAGTGSSGLESGEEELRHWASMLPADLPRLPVDLEEGEDRVATAATLSVELGEDETRRLLHEVPQAYQTQIDDVLLTALVEAFASWTGQRRLFLEMEGHGREDLGEDVDVSRTVGWFTSIFPVVLDLEDRREPGEALKSVKEQLRSIPRRGMGYGMLRYLAPGEVRQTFRRQPRAQLVWNYLGQLDQVLARDGALGGAEEAIGPSRSPRQLRPHLFEINAAVRGGRLQISWTFSRNRHHRPTVEALGKGFLEALRRLIDHCLSPDAGGYTPSDFPLAELDHEALDKVTASVGGPVSDIFPLSPLQLGMLFHGLQDPGSGVYVQQLDVRFRGEFDDAAFEKAWQDVVCRHPSLRTGFAWSGLHEPLQVVLREARWSWDRHDWRELTTQEQDAKLEAYLDQGRRRGFDLEKPPLFRLAMIRLAEDLRCFVWTYHHLLLDGWSLPVLFGDLFALYGSRRSGEPPRLDPAPLYRDYIAWLRDRDASEAEAFWRQTLAGFQAPTPLGVDRPGSRPPLVGAPRHSTLETALTAAHSGALESFARRQHVTLNTLSQAAWAWLLAGYSGEDDVVFGVVSSGRSAPIPNIESTVGVFINTLPARVRLPRRMALTDWLRRIQSEQVRVRDYEYSHLVDVHGWSEVPRTVPLFESILIFENYPLGALLDGETEFESDRARLAEQTNFPLNLLVLPGSEQLTLRLLYDEGRFDPTAAARVLNHLVACFESMLGAPETELGDVSAMSRIERHQLGVELNDTAVGGRGRQLVHGLFESRARLVPESVAVVFEEFRLSYGELDARGNQLAWHLGRLGVGPDVLVGLAVDRSPDMAIAVMGILKAGGAYVPLDPSFPQARLDLMLEDALRGQGVRVLVTRSELAGRFSDRVAGLCVIRLDEDRDRIRREPVDAPPVVQTSGHLAYVIYTSGSTGRPKGVQVTHRSLVNFLVSMGDRPGLEAEDVWLAVTTLSFDIAGLELFLPWIRGARVELVGRETAGDAHRLAACLSDSGATVMQATPATWRMLLDNGWPGCRGLKALCGGEALPGELAARLEPAVAELWNLYGPTETTIWSTIHPVQDPRDVPLGRPIANTRLHLFGRGWERVPMGAAGELHVAGAGLARGYLRRPAMTAERFVPDPYGEEAGTRLYKTGDLARVTTETELRFLGRIDHQVKLRGFRIELGEIEAVLTTDPEVRQAVVSARAGAGDHLVAYVVADAGDAEGLRSRLEARLREKLPHYMIPGFFAFLDAMPLTPNGKVDRRALPVYQPMGSEVGFVAPAEPLEMLLAEIWEEVLGTEQVGLEDDFFAIGGHSLKAVRVISLLRETIQVEIPVHVLFETRKLGDLSRRLSEDYLDESHLEGLSAIWNDVDELTDEQAETLLVEEAAIGGELS